MHEMHDPAEALRKLQKLCEKDAIEMIDLKFIDVPGKWQHLSIPISQLSERMFSEGIGFDGSSIRGFQTIEESDLVLLPDVNTARRDPFCDVPTLSMIADPMDPSSGSSPTEYSMNPRAIARRAVAYLRQSGIADEVFIGPEIEFFIFDHVRFGTNGHYAFHEIDAQEGYWNTETMMNGGNLGHRPQSQSGYFPVPPVDSDQNLRTEMVMELQRAGMEVEAQHHEVAGPGQAEIDIRFKPLVEQADNVMMYKYIVQNVAHRRGKTVTFMPKPLFQQSGNGMHTHQSLWKDGKPLFFGNEYANLSTLALQYIAGLLRHARSFLAFGAPTTNSYKRLTPGYEAPVVLTYSKRNRSAATRIPMYNNRPEAKRIEFRSADPLANPYTTFAAMLMAGIDGIKKEMDPGKPHEENLFELEGEAEEKLSYVPSSLDEALNDLERNHAYLCEGNVFSEEFIANYIAWKRKHEVDAVRLRPHPHEFELYYSA